MKNQGVDEIKKGLILKARKRWPGKRIKPCGFCETILESFTYEKKHLMFWYRVEGVSSTMSEVYYVN